MVVAFLLLLVLVGISSADTVYTWYYGKQLASFLQAMNSYISSMEFMDLWKVVIGFSFILLLFAVIASAGDYRQSIRLLWFYGLVIVVWYLLVVIKTPVDVVDMCTKTTYSNIQAPWAVAKPLSWFTTLEKNVRNGLVSFFGIFLPDAYKQNEGCFTGYELLRPALTYQPKDPYLRLSIESYIKDCIIPTIMAGDIDRFSLVNSNDLWNNEFACTTGKLCAALTTVYYNSTNPEGIVDGCPNVYSRISADIVNEYSRAWRDIKAKVFGTASAISETDIPVYLGEITPFLMSVALTGENLVRQAITIQSLGQVSAEFATAVAYQEAYLNALARINMLDFGRGGTLNAMKGVIETLWVGLTPAFFLLLLTPLGGRLFSGWIMGFLWVSLWSIAEVTTVALLFLSVGDNQKFDFTLSQIDRINLAFNKAAQISSMMSDYIPLVTLILATGGSLYAMVHFARGMSKELRDEHGTKVMSSGNLDVGNVRARGYADLATSLATSSVGAVNWGSANAGTWTGNELRVGNTTVFQYQGYDRKLGANLSGVWENPSTFIGKIEGGTYSGQNGRWHIDGNRAVLIHGSAHAATSAALEQITGGQITGLRDADVRMANGQLVYARGIDEMTGAEVTYRRSSDGIETMSYNYGSWTAQLMKDKNGEWRVVGGSGPVDLNVAQRYVENLENSKAQMDRVATAFRSSEGISNTDSQTFNAGYRLAYDIAHGKGGASEYERGFARDLIRSTEEAALTRLANEGKLSLEGKEIDEFEARKKGRGGISLGLPEFLKKKLGENLRLGASVDKVIATKDGYVVQDTKGRYWFFGKNESINDALRDAWKTTVSGENKDFFSYRENATDGKYTSEDFRKDLTSFRSRASEYAATRAEELSRRISFARQNAREINAKATQLLIGDYVKKADGDDIRDKTGKALTELNTLVSTPQGMRELMGAADRVVDELIKDRSLERPNVNETEVRSAANRAEVEGSRARNVEVQAPSRDAEQVYQQVRSNIEGRMGRMGEEYQQSREAVDAQKNVYESTKMNSPMETLPEVSRFDQLREEIQDLLKQKSDLAARISKEERDLRTDLRTFLAASTGGQLNFGEAMELIKNPDKLREYREKGPYDKLDPNVFESFSERYSAIQEMRQELAGIQKELDTKMKEYEELKPYAQARDLQRGDYEVKYRDDKGPGKHPKIETTTEQATEGLDKKIEDYKEDRKTPEEKKKEMLRKVDEKVKKEYPDALKDFLY